MGRDAASQRKVLAILSDGKPRSHRDIVKELGLSDPSVWSVLRRCWRRRLILRTKEPVYWGERVFRGGAGVRTNPRPFHLYVFAPSDNDDGVQILGREFVKFSEQFYNSRGCYGGESKSKLIMNFLKEHQDKAWFSKGVVEALKDRGVKITDIMANVRRYERQGLVYVRGYRNDSGQTPFNDGYLLTWIDPDKPREQAIEEAVQRTNEALVGIRSVSPIIERVHLIKDLVIESTKLKDLVSLTFLQNKLDCSEYEVEEAIIRTLQLYPDIKEIKLFDAYRYFYHKSMADEDLKAAITMKENYIRIIKGRSNRIGHNWEACVEWFIDKFTVGAKFWTQSHRTEKMDPRRITIHLIKSVGRRRLNAEVDRVWEVTPSVFAQPITYILECKWGLIRKRSVDDFLEVLRWSKDFGVNTSEGRQVKQGVVGVFAGSAFDPKESVHLKNEKVSLARYANRINIQLLKASDFNEKLHEHGCPTALTVQRICKVARDEGEARKLLEAIWADPKKSLETLAEVERKNKALYEFEDVLRSQINPKQMSES